MILTDDNFATIVGAVEEGRSIFANIRRVVVYLLGTNSGEILTLMAAGVIAVPIAAAASSAAPLDQPGHRWRANRRAGARSRRMVASSMSHRARRTRPLSPARSSFASPSSLSSWRRVTIGTFIWAWRNGDLALARTVAFATMSVFQLFNISQHALAHRFGLPHRPLEQPVGHLGSPSRRRCSSPRFISDSSRPRSGQCRSPWASGIVVLVSSTVLIAEEIRKRVAPRLFGLRSRTRTRRPGPPSGCGEAPRGRGTDDPDVDAQPLR